MGKPLNNSKRSESDSKISGWLFANMLMALYSLQRALKYLILFKVHYRLWGWVLWSLFYGRSSCTQNWGQWCRFFAPVSWILDYLFLHFTNQSFTFYYSWCATKFHTYFQHCSCLGIWRIFLTTSEVHVILKIKIQTKN